MVQQLGAICDRREISWLSKTYGSNDVFKIGDRVLVSVSRQGVIAVIGETKFAAEWARIVLDAFRGMNDEVWLEFTTAYVNHLKKVFSKTTTLTRLKLLRTPVLRSRVGHYLLCQGKMLKKDGQIITMGLHLAS